MRRALVILGPLALAGCSVVFDPGTHQGGAADGGGMDAGPRADGGDPTVDGGTDGGPPQLPLDMFCQTYAQTFCEAAESCCPAPGEVAMDCADSLTASCTEALRQVEVDSRVTYDPVVAAATLEEGRALVGGCATQDLLSWLADREGFFAPFVGAVAGGERCDPVEASVALLVCANPNQTCRGLFRKDCLDRGAIGDECWYRTECAEGLFCPHPGRTCSAAGEPNGSECRYNDECASLFCTGNWLIAGECAEATEATIYCSAATDG